MRLLIALFVMLLAGCGTATPGTTVVPTAPPTAAATAAPTVAVTPAPVATATPAPPAATSRPPVDCDPAYEDCDPRYTPRPQSTPPPAGDELVVALSPDGTYLVDEAGMSLYTFDRDGPNSSDCTSSDCLDSWPPLLLAPDQAVAAGEGIEGELSGFDRGGGDIQVSYNSMPLYYFAGDSAPGDTNGDGVNDVWHLAVP